MQYALLGVLAVLTVVAVAWLSPRIGVAAPVVLVLVGVGCSFIPGVPEVELGPDLILMVVLPPILYAAALNVPITDFRRNFKAISGLSVLLVIASAVVVGLLLHWLLPDLGLAAAIALGAVVSPPDAVAATSIGKRLGLPSRLVTVLEGEGLVNDATALVLLRSAVAATAGTVTLVEVAGDFVFAVVAAVGIGLAIGFATVWVRARIDSPVLNTAISFVVPFLAFIPAEEVHASGVLAVVVAGLVTGHQSSRHFTPADRIAERTNWRTIQLLLENGVFLLMGFQFSSLVEEAEGGSSRLRVLTAVSIGLLITLVLILVRVLFVVPLVAVLRREQQRAEERTPRLESALDRLGSREPSEGGESPGRLRAERFLRRQHADATFLAQEGLGWRGGGVLAWSGMRGVVTLAAAQSLPAGLPYRSQLVLIAFTVALVTLVGLGGTLPLVIARLGVAGTDAASERRELATLVEEILTVGEDAVANPELRRPDGRPYDHEALDDLRRLSRAIRVALSTPPEADQADRHPQRRELRRVFLEATHDALLDARASGRYSSRVLERAQAVLDAEATRFDDPAEHG